MKILGICGSPRGEKSNTKILTEKMLEEMKNKCAEVEMIDLGKEKVGFCIACEKCHQGPECIIHDKGNQILEKMLNADGIVFASPVYISHVTAQMKALLDRTSHFIHCKRLLNKYTAGITTSGGGQGEKEVLEYIKHYSLTVGAQFVGGVGARVPLKEEDFLKVKTLAEKLHNAIKNKEVYADQIKSIEEMKKHFARIIPLRKDQWTYEYEYWKKQNWL